MEWTIGMIYWIAFVLFSLFVMLRLLCSISTYVPYTYTIVQCYWSHEPYQHLQYRPNDYCFSVEIISKCSSKDEWCMCVQCFCWWSVTLIFCLHIKWQQLPELRYFECIKSSYKENLPLFVIIGSINSVLKNSSMVCEIN